MDKGFPTHVGAILERILGRSEYKQKFQEAKLVNLWPEIAGPHLSRHTYPTRFSRGRLTCTVDNSALLSELQYMKKDLLKKIEEITHKNTVKDIFFVLGVIGPVSK
ncbi:MAG: DUF721 domain-containing protein [Deltaproteobacteria bacterium]|nr:DUF721 domain-containing protein [Deltaproteobacteria bacterium]